MGTDPKPPPRLRARGRALWHEVTAVYDLTPAELAILAEACVTADEIDQLRAELRAQGLTVRGSAGQPRAHPALAALRSSRQVLGQLLGQLQLPDPAAPQRPVLPTLRQASARKAASDRWAAR